MKLGSTETDEEWSCLANKMEEEVLRKDKVHEASWHKYVGRSDLCSSVQCSHMSREAWLRRASTTFFFFYPKHVPSERLIALLPTIIRGWEWLKSFDVVE